MTQFSENSSDKSLNTVLKNQLWIGRSRYWTPLVLRPWLSRLEVAIASFTFLTRESSLGNTSWTLASLHGYVVVWSTSSSAGGLEETPFATFPKFIREVLYSSSSLAKVKIFSQKNALGGINTLDFIINKWFGVSGCGESVRWHVIQGKWSGVHYSLNFLYKGAKTFIVQLTSWFV